MNQKKVSTIGKKFGSKIRELTLLSEIRNFGTWLYGKKPEEKEEDEFIRKLMDSLVKFTIASIWESVHFVITRM